MPARAAGARAAFAEAAGLDLDALPGPAIRGWVTSGLATDDGTRIRIIRAGLLASDSFRADVLG